MPALILLLQISAVPIPVGSAAGSDTVPMAVEVHPQLKTEDIVEQLEEGGVRVASHMELIPLHEGTVLGVPRLEVKIHLDSVLTLETQI